MRIEGRLVVPLSRSEAWRRLNDPSVVLRCAPGLERLEETRPDHFDAVLDLKLPAVTGRFSGTLDLLERIEPERLRVRLQGKGQTGFVEAEATLELFAEDSGTRVSYVADVQVGGQVARLGQRMISGVAKEMAREFFEALGGGANNPAPASPWRALLRAVWRALLNLLGLSRRS